MGPQAMLQASMLYKQQQEQEQEAYTAMQDQSVSVQARQVLFSQQGGRGPINGHTMNPPLVQANKPPQREVGEGMLADVDSVFYADLERRNQGAWHNAGREAAEGATAESATTELSSELAVGGCDGPGDVALLADGAVTGVVVDEEGSLPDGAGAPPTKLSLVEQINGLLAREKQASWQLSSFISGSLRGR
jgi:hypothetical protein